MTSLKTSIKTITYLSDIGCLEIQGASLLCINDSKNMFVYTTLNYIRENLLPLCQTSLYQTFIIFIMTGE
ncbi:hypothetical protein BK352_24125 [Escherichia coli]|nr:hypothetical protein BK352_24125 [Escherichia coli]RLW72504.1 hypothetical protein EAI72_23700 [Escherichia coli]